VTGAGVAPNGLVDDVGVAGSCMRLAGYLNTTARRLGGTETTMSEHSIPSVTHASEELASAARYLARALAAGATSHMSAVEALVDWVKDGPAEVAPAAYAVAHDQRALDLLTCAAFEVAA